MTLSLVLLVGMAALYTCGVYLLLERSLTRMLLGILLVGNATNILLFFMSGSFGLAPIYDPDVAPEDYSDPIPQAFILTAIVITFGVTAFMLALIYRSWRLAQADTVSDDEEDIAMRTADLSQDDEEFDEDDSGDTEFGEYAEAAVSTARINMGGGPKPGSGKDSFAEASLKATEPSNRHEELEEFRAGEQDAEAEQGSQPDGAREVGLDSGADDHAEPHDDAGKGDRS
ncbi:MULTISPECIES: Na(+)/H(+) antiporter subunit C [unclassified Pseudoclavibacter]|uniref:Na(+)/H(+) antiporter subunit C n=1 Tax=unclassified Pseudoclavibacter TaxID=2615177 RepID=UPI000CE873E1|nr:MULTISPECIES: Na(+)/H(+) antiporter subunit C [unclassified Pseudoclavibacter]MBF4552174.1 Na(+)/H(+) antiporter subunit C [Pseudoclavibacter sp. VKM Ac-2888]PPF32980.1 Na(+)/H(+) antiporter subunit C [Pseudoclavibacter sp. AY1H1]PPG04635.1 Na(+)/H(+) antiporter subunit C [Pseudoclavibacter sp. RFBI5]